MTNDQMLIDGFSTIYSLSNLPLAKLYEKDVTPPGMSANGPIDITNMRNLRYRTSAPKSLITTSPMSATVAYATEVLDQLRDQIGVNQQVTLTYPDGARYVFWGWPEDFTPSTHTEGEQPTATMMVHLSNRNNEGAESWPDYIAPAAS